MNHPTVVIKKSVYRSGNPGEKPGYVEVDITVNAGDEKKLNLLPLRQMWDKNKKKWGCILINTSTLHHRKDGKRMYSVPEYLYSDTSLRRIRRKNTNVLDYSYNNLKF